MLCFFLPDCNPRGSLPYILKINKYQQIKITGFLSAFMEREF